MTTTVSSLIPEAFKHRKQTRMERYRQKIDNGDVKVLPIQAACVNFGNENNYAMACRAATCYGANKIHLIGNYQGPRMVLRAVSGTTQDLLETIVHKSPGDFVRYCRENNIKIIALELPSDFDIVATPLDEYEFDFSGNQEYVICSGNETVGVDIEILKNADCLFIQMFGKSHCLNTSQALNVGLYEAVRQWNHYNKENN